VKAAKLAQRQGDGGFVVTADMVGMKPVPRTMSPLSYFETLADFGLSLLEAQQQGDGK
jgi:hypothetical protein